MAACVRFHPKFETILTIVKVVRYLARSMCFFNREGICHAVVLWMDFQLTDDVCLSTGLVKVGLEYFTWV